ncbi:MAG: TraM recognition domain-containing protein, partial [Acidimicrobiales bacterium]
MLDEMATICPLPNLPSYLADGGGRGIQVIYMVQAPAQLRRRYGAAGAAAIRGATNVLLVGGGIDDPRDLEDWSKLVGEVSVSSRLRTWGRGGRGSWSESESVARRRVLEPAEIYRLSPGQVLLFARDTRAGLVALPCWWAGGDAGVVRGWREKALEATGRG